MNTPDTTPMDIAELRACRFCGRGVMNDSDLVFYELSLQSCVVDLRNVRQMAGMEMMMGGAIALARALSPSTTVAHRMGRPVRHLICMPCASQGQEILPLLLMEQDKEQADG